LVYASNLKMKIKHSSGMLVYFYQITWQHIPKTVFFVGTATRISNLTKVFFMDMYVKMSNFLKTFMPTLCSRVLEKLRVTQLVKKSPAFYGTKRSSTIFTRTCHYPEPTESLCTLMLFP
jgi:hypothetical protein